MEIEKVNGYWVPSKDKHIEQWKSGGLFTQNRCLNKFIANNPKAAPPRNETPSKVTSFILYFSLSAFLLSI